MAQHAFGLQMLRIADAAAENVARLSRVPALRLHERALDTTTIDKSKPPQSSLSSFFTCFASRSTIASVCVSVITSELRMALQITIVCASEPVQIEQEMRRRKPPFGSRTEQRIRPAGKHSAPRKTEREQGPG